MRNNSDHAMFPTASHDEQAAQGFVKTLRVFSTRNFLAGNGALLEEKGLADANTSAPSRRDLREALAGEPANQWWSAMLRTTQEVLYDTVGPTIERQLPELIARASELRGKLGSLTLDDGVEVPPYLTAVDMHCKPGSYQQEMVADDVFAGAEFDRTFRLYSMGSLGPNLDDMGHTLIAWMREHFGDVQPTRILDVGCTVGHSTLPYCDVFPDAEVHAIDVAATCLRYAHARAVAMDKEVHFSQQNAEHTNFEDGSFDLVVSHVMLHETSRRACRAIFKECHRLLKPGGIMIHMDGICPSDPLQKYYADWQAIYNNEPYLGTVQDEDFTAICTRAGFDEGNVTLSQAKSQFQTRANDEQAVRSYQIVCAQK